jgi:superfamily I DNA/RNA helicase
MNPFESARREAAKLRAELASSGVNLNQGAYLLVESACKALDVTLRKVKSTVPLLKGSDATINIAKKWTFVRNDVPDEVKAFLVAHELGHLRLHPHTHGTVEVTQEALTGEADTNGVKEVESYGARERQELQANVFAREFLLPRAIARTDFLDARHSASRIASDRQLPTMLVWLQLYDAVLLPDASAPSRQFSLPDKPTQAQAPAVNSDATTSLVEAGPGTGKTTALLLRLRRLIAEGHPPDSIVILTFSNKAARELVERARAGNIAGADRVWIGTFHAFGLEFLRKFGDLLGLEPRLPVLDKLAALAMLEDSIPSLELEAYDPLSNPSPWLETVVDAIRRSKDEVFTASRFAEAVAAEADVNADVVAKRRDVSAIFERYEQLLARRKAVDLTDLLCASIRLMQSGEAAVERFLGGIRHLMVDEYQDVNRASALLVKELSEKARTTWVVGDANQAIYAFMGASSSNLSNFQLDFPDATSIPLAHNHRSSQEIVDAFSTVAMRNPAGRPTIAMQAVRGCVGHRPMRVRAANEQEETSALAWRIKQLEADGTALAEQAVIVYKNATAADAAQGLEAQGVPVLYLGNIFERAEVKDLICLLQLAVDEYGMNLVRQWQSPHLALSREGADRIFDQTRTEECSWRDASGKGLSARDAAAFSNLKRLCGLVKENMSPWDALAGILLKDGEWLRELASQPGQAAANSMMAVWQFVHFCRSPDGTGRWSTVRNLTQRIRDRVRLGEDRSLRAVPPEAEGMNAVRVLTAHGSKGLEFDAVHIVGFDKSAFEPTQAKTNKLLPDAVLSASSALGILKNERHNLLYVAVSRPRFHLTVYSTDEALPGALEGLLTPLTGDWPKSVPMATPPLRAPTPLTEVSLQDYLSYVKCPQRYEMTARAGGWQWDELKLHRAVEVATRRAMRALAADPALLASGEWPGAVTQALAEFKLDAHPAAGVIRERVARQVERGRDLLLEGGDKNSKASMELGPLRVGLEPDQIFESGGVRRMRFIRIGESSFTSMKQPLAALLDAHHQAGGATTTIEVATLATGETRPVGKIQTKTRATYQEVAEGMCAKQFAANPESDRTCHFCGYMFPCSRRVSD